MTVTLTSAGSSVPNWQLISTNSPSAVTTVTFSSLAGYSKYRILMQNIVAISGTTTITLNGDTSAHYSVSRVTGGGTSPSVSVNGTGISTLASDVNPACDLLIDNALILTPKAITGWITEGTTTGSMLFNLNAVYQTTSALTSITITRSANFTSGSIYLLGAN